MRVLTRNCLIAFAAGCWAASVAAAEPLTVGWIERVRLDPGGLVLTAKLDTGANTSSLHAAHITRFTRDGENWVAFDVVDQNDNTQRFERRIVRISRIKRHGGGVQERPTVLLDICLGGLAQSTQVNLVNREGFNYQLLVGRRFLGRHFAVNSAQTYTVEPACPRRPQ